MPTKWVETPTALLTFPAKIFEPHGKANMAQSPYLCTRNGAQGKSVTISNPGNSIRKLFNASMKNVDYLCRQEIMETEETTKL